MNREDQIKQAAAKAEENLKHIDPDVTTDYALGFEAGARWADDHFDSRKNNTRCKAFEMGFEAGLNCSPWISVEERLPKHREFVLISGYSSVDRENRVVTMSRIWKYRNGRYSWDNDYIQPTHWLPIPPIKKGGEK